MSIVKPYTFTAGTKARANEVNANFDTLYSQVNLNISDIATNSNEIDNLENNKAEVNGSSTQRFAVADATSSSDAINKQTLEKAITPLFGYINGLMITKDSASPNDTIIVDIGSCYDSTNSKVLVLDASVSKQNTNQGANTIYYVYIIGTSTGNTTDILISSTNVEPTLPTGYTLYRLIGNYTTDSNGNINIISNIMAIYNSYQITSASLPKWSGKVGIGNGGTAPFDGWLVWKLGMSGIGSRAVMVNSITVGYAMYSRSDGTGYQSGVVPVNKGDVITWQTDKTTGAYFVVYPQKGL